LCRSRVCSCGTFSQHSAHIQCTFSVSCADAREPPSQLQETIEKSTKVDARYNLPV
jgi:hypothetical protein